MIRLHTEDCENSVASRIKLFFTKSRALSAMLGLTLVTAGVLKGYELATAPRPGTGILESRWILLAAVQLELLLGLWLIGGMAPREARIAALGCFSVFLVASAWHVFKGKESCGCLASVPLSPWVSLTFDFVAVASLWCWRPPEPRTMSGRRQLGFATLAVLLAAAGLLAAFRKSASELTEEGEFDGNGAVVLLEPEKWLGKRFPLLRHMDVGSRLAQGQWTVVLYQRDCEECQRVIEQYRSRGFGRSREPADPGIAFIAVSGEAERGGKQEGLAPGILWGRLRSGRRWLVRTPVVLSIVNGHTMRVSTEGRLFAHSSAVSGNP